MEVQISEELRIARRSFKENLSQRLRELTRASGQ